MTKQLKALVHCFRTLRGWKVRYDDFGLYEDQSHSNAQRKLGVVYRSSKQPLPQDYLLHEVLHFALREVRVGTQREQRAKQEQLVRDLCRYLERNCTIPPDQGGDQKGRVGE